MISLLSFNLLLQTLLAFLSLFFLKKNKSLFTYILCLFLTSTALLELFCFYLMKQTKPTFLYIHFYSLFEYIVIFLMYNNLIKQNKKTYISKFLLIISSVFWFVTFFEKDYFSIMTITGSLNIAIMVFLYLRELLMSDQILSYKKLLPFWVSVGFLIFYLPSIPFFSLLEYMKDRGLFFILIILTLLKSLFIIYGLLTCNKEEKY